MKFRLILIPFIFIIFSGPVFSLTESDIRITQDDLKKSGCEFSKDMYYVSIQAGTLYSMFSEKKSNKMLPETQRHYYVSSKCGGENSTIYYYEFKDRIAAQKALNFIKPLIWGGFSPTQLHPERIIHLDNYIIVISSRKSNQLDDLLSKKIIYLPVKDPLFASLTKRLKCKSGEFDSPCGVLNAFLEKKYLPLDQGGPYFGNSWEIDNNGKIKKIFYEVIELRKINESLYGYWFPIRPDNDTEKAQILDIINKQKRGEKADLPVELKNYLDGQFKKISKEVVKRSNVTFLQQRGNVAQIQRVRNGIILIVTTEHFTGKPEGIIIAYFWYKGK